MVLFLRTQIARLHKKIQELSLENVTLDYELQEKLELREHNIETDVRELSTKTESEKEEQPCRSARCFEKEEDSVIAHRTEELYSETKSLVEKHFGQVEWDYEKLGHEGKWILQRYASVTGHGESAEEHIRFIQIIVARVLVEYFRRSYYFGGGEAALVVNAATLTKYFEEIEDKHFSHWLVQTREMIGWVDGAALSMGQVEMAMTMAQHLHIILQAAVTTDWSDSLAEDLENLSNRAFEVYKTLHEQPDMMYGIEMPNVGADSGWRDFDPDTMEDVDGVEDESELKGRVLATSIFPALYKLDGPDHQPRSVLLKARVTVHEKEFDKREAVLPESKARPTEESAEEL